ncbi:MAG: hypothetical protein GTO65_02860 [Armatimonadetes bacterium]|nr:hypothetical protein [Armatimonadota bacterium]
MKNTKMPLKKSGLSSSLQITPPVFAQTPCPANDFLSENMRILVLTEGTVIIHKCAAGHSREEIERQVGREQESVHDYASYVPVGDAVKKLVNWRKDGAEILYLTSRRKPEEIGHIKNVLSKYGFPEGQLLFRRENEEYKDVAERVVPDVLVEDDCESIGGISEMTITHVEPEIKKRIKSIPVKEFGGIDHLPDETSALLKYQPGLA